MTWLRMTGLRMTGLPRVGLPRVGVALAVLLATLFAACGGRPEPSSSSGGATPPVSAPPSGSGTGAAAGIPSSPPATGASATAAAAAPACARQVLAGLSPRQRVGQLFIVGVPVSGSASARSQAVRAATGIAAGGYILYGRSRAGVASVRGLAADVSATLAARAAGVDPFVAADQEGGQIQALGGPGFSTIPPALEQGTWSASRLRAAARRWGTELHDAGVNVDFAPVLDVVPTSLGTANQPIGRYQREFGHAADGVAEHGTAVVRGLQEAGVAATAKHFPGLGRVRGNPDFSSGVTDPRTTPDDPALQPFAAAARAGVEFVMISSASYPRLDPDRLAVFSPAVMALLRGRFGFHGLVVSDDLGAARQVASVPAGRRATEFLAAGGQVVLVVKPTRVAAAAAAGLLAAAQRDAAVRLSVDAAALSVLATKQRLGLLHC